eukprot:c25610_g1_i1.p1 GENE.c25610_g1_i1~~c25610_g1_i1.p1  ORF type:complete len:159 (+),score=44.01 c25610_g1_i1:43-519(+)
MTTGIDKICQHLFFKVTHTILLSRIHDIPYTKLNNDFNLGGGEIEKIRQEVESCYQGGCVVIDVFGKSADVEGLLAQPQVVGGRRNSSGGFGGNSSRKFIVLERWKLSLEKKNENFDSIDSASVSKFFKRLTILVRTLHTTTRILPLFRVYKLNKEVI